MTAPILFFFPHYLFILQTFTRSSCVSSIQLGTGVREGITKNAHNVEGELEKQTEVCRVVVSGSEFCTKGEGSPATKPGEEGESVPF